MAGWLRSSSRKIRASFYSLTAIGCNQVVERNDFSVDDFRRALAYVVLLTMCYVLACYRSFIKSTAIGVRAIVFLQRLAIALTFERPFKAGLSTVVSLRAITNLGSHCGGGQKNE